MAGNSIYCHRVDFNFSGDASMKNSLFRSPIIPVLFMVLLSLDVSVMIFEKMGAAAAGTAVGDELKFYLRLIQLPWTWMVIILSPIQLLTWSKILSKTEL